ncbi:MAG: hypothetical protein A2Y79_11645 [Deltaproteobacteria bacterium RBG_13_43_22]|nr:MAG: hypothetical protein A2Y79_11645 [Deltaproteobacteria bacterium RBG_13_43_22]
MSEYEENTCFLFARPGFLQGFASAIDLGGTLINYNESKTPQEADARAIASDWAITGKDILTAVKNLDKK